MDSFESTVLKKYRRLSQVLIISSLLNIAFASSAVYQYFKPLKPKEWALSKSPLTEDAQSVLKNFLSLNFQDLVSKIALKTQIEPGLYKRDLALAILNDSYHIDLARALNKTNLATQQLSYVDNGKQKWISVPRGLSDSDFELVSQFLKHEAWPLTAKGLFLKLKMGVKDPELFLSFHRSLEFARLYDAINISGLGVKEETLSSILMKGEYADFELYSDCVINGGFSQESFFQHFTKLGSQASGIILTDLPNFSVKTLSDTEALDLLDTLSSNPDKQKKMANELLASFRSDHFKQEIIKKGIVETQSVQLVNQVVERPQVTLAVKEKKVVKEPVKKTSLSKKTYVIQDGDSLWKISRKFKVDIEALKAANHLESESLKPGKVLIIP